MLSHQRSADVERAQPVRASYGAPPKLKNADQSSADAGQGALPRRNLSENRRNAGDSGFRNAGEQAILRTSTMNNAGIKMETAPKQDYPIGATMTGNIPPSGKSGAATGAPGKPPIVVGSSASNNQKGAPTAAANAGAPFELEPIENYKGKSLGELEAILDAHNAVQAKKKAAANE